MCGGGWAVPEARCWVRRDAGAEQPGRRCQAVAIGKSVGLAGVGSSRYLAAGQAACHGRGQWGLEQATVRDDALLLAQSNGDSHLRSLTSTSSGRNWDVEAVLQVN